MKATDRAIIYIVLHFIPVPDWGMLPYRNKWHYHYVVTGNEKCIVLKPIDPLSAVIQVAFLGSERNAHESKALFTLLFELFSTHSTVRIVQAIDLIGPKDPVLAIARWLTPRIPRWISKRLPPYSAITTLQSLLSLTS